MIKGLNGNSNIKQEEYLIVLCSSEEDKKKGTWTWEISKKGGICIYKIY